MYHDLQSLEEARRERAVEFIFNGSAFDHLFFNRKMQLVALVEKYLETGEVPTETE